MVWLGTQRSLLKDKIMKTKEELDKMPLEEIYKYKEKIYEEERINHDFLYDYLEERENRREHLSVIEKEFMEIYDKYGPQIREHLNEARTHLYKAVELSNEHGIPFRSDLSPLRQNYWPWKNLKYKKILDFIKNNVDARLRDMGNCSGWKNSDNACADW